MALLLYSTGVQATQALPLSSNLYYTTLVPGGLGRMWVEPSVSEQYVHAHVMLRCGGQAAVTLHGGAQPSSILNLPQVRLS